MLVPMALALVSVLRFALRYHQCAPSDGVIMASSLVDQPRLAAMLIAKRGINLQVTSAWALAFVEL